MFADLKVRNYVQLWSSENFSRTVSDNRRFRCLSNFVWRKMGSIRWSFLFCSARFQQRQGYVASISSVPITRSEE